MMRHAEAKLRPVMIELAYNLESFNPAFTAVMLKVHQISGRLGNMLGTYLPQLPTPAWLSPPLHARTSPPPFPCPFTGFGVIGVLA